MALYRFRVSNPAGIVSELLIEGDSQADATRRVQRRGLMPIQFLGEGALPAEGRRSWSFRRRLDVYDFTDRLVPLLEADIPIERALGIISDGMDDPFARQLVSDMRRGLHEGRKFSQLIHDRDYLFPPIFASVVEAGEEAGALPGVMAQLHRFLGEARELRSFIISASIYPIVVLCVSLGLVTALLGFVVPRFAGVLATAGRHVPPLTQFLLDISAALRQYWWAFPLALALFLLLIREARRETGPVREAWDRLLLRLPLVRRVTLMSNLARMARTMATLMRSGAHLLDTVTIASRVIQNTPLRRSVSGLAAGLRRGERLSHALSQSSLIPSFMIRMIAVGEETGEVEAMLNRVADRYEQELRRLIRRVLSVFEPAVIICLGLIVGLIVASMFLAIMDVQSGL
ncbi:MAG: type II secretion system F family protein [Kiritimatiellaeota bacterium]|nr:type II secretion system F family protein [Kiritimatiellota bacterium]